MTDTVVPVMARLTKRYPVTRTALHYRTPHQLLVATILSAQCTDVRINKITPALFKKYRSVTAFAGARQQDMEALVRSAGFFRNKSKNIIRSAQQIVEDFGSRVPDTMEGLISLAGVSRKTANIILSHVYGKAEGIAVDTHVARISRRLGWSKHTDPKKIEIDLMDRIPRKHWLDLNAMLVFFGREVCRARNPACPGCPLARYCPACVKKV